jgi:dodecin
MSRHVGFLGQHFLNPGEIGLSEEFLVFGIEVVPAVVSEESLEPLVIHEPRSLRLPELLLQVEVAPDAREKIREPYVRPLTARDRTNVPHRGQDGSRSRSTGSDAESEKEASMSDVAKVVTIIGSSPESFAKAADAAVQEASKTVRGITGAHVVSMSAEVEGDHISSYRTTVNIAFGVERSS